jgi:riboflavin synthase
VFTGIVQRLATVEALDASPELARITLDLGPLAHGLETGASVAVNGTCLTVTAVRDALVSFDAVRGTLELTNLGSLAQGDRVNVERSFRVGDEVGGHILSGHVFGTASVVAREDFAEQARMTFELPEGALPFVMPKGYVALDGASLTIAELDRSTRRIVVNLIPETLERTRFGFLQPGDRVNVEVDAQTQAVVETVRALLTDPEQRAALLAVDG